MEVKARERGRSDRVEIDRGVEVAIDVRARDVEAAREVGIARELRLPGRGVKAGEPIRERQHAPNLRERAVHVKQLEMDVRTKLLDLRS